MNIVDQRCANHALREAAAQCPSCKRFFCRECVTEHHGRMICVSCVTIDTTRPRARFQAGWTVMALAGIVIAWLVFYYLGLALARIPSEFHAEPEARRWRELHRLRKKSLQATIGRRNRLPHQSMLSSYSKVGQALSPVERLFPQPLQLAATSPFDGATLT